MRLPILCALLGLLACKPAATAHDALQKVGSPLPAALESCAVIDDVDGGRRCRLYDTQARAFTDAPDPLLRRVLLFERWTDKWSAVEKQLGVRVLKEPMAPGDPESRFSDERLLAGYDALGDAASYGEETGIAAAFRCATTGTPADCQRLEDYVRGGLLQFEVTGVEGYLARAHFARVPAGTPARNGRATQELADGELVGVYDVAPEIAAASLPAYYREGAARPAWYGHPSIDAYVGPMNSWPIAFGLLRDPALKARMARQYGCFLKRLRMFKIVNLSKNQALQTDVAHYLSQGLVHLEPGEPDLTRLDQVIGFYLPQYNHRTAADYPRECPAALAEEASEKDLVDVSRVGWEGKLLDLFQRQVEGGPEAADHIDFAFFANLRAGDAAMLLSYATAASYLSGDDSFAHWRDRVLIGKANARETARTLGAFIPPKPCRSYYRGPGVYSSMLGRLLIEGDPNERAFWADLWRRKLAGGEVKGLGDHLFAVMTSAALGDKGEPLAAALSELASFGGAPGHLDDPRRNYFLDVSAAPPPGIEIGKPDPTEVKFCEGGITLLGVTIPGSKVDESLRLTSDPLPLMLRAPDSWMWSSDPFQATPRWHSNPPGQRQYSGVDLTEPYWIARHAGLIADPHLVLAWGPE